MIKEIKCEALVLGAGPAGLSAAIYLKRSNVDTLIIRGKVPSALRKAHKIENYAGISSISGPELLDRMIKQVKDLGVEILDDDVLALTLTMDPKMASTKTAFITADTIIIATGKGARKPEMDNEEKFIGLGVSYCATCDGPLYRDRHVCLVGDDDETAEDILILNQMGCKVTWLIKKKNLDELDIQAVKINEIKEKSIPIRENVRNMKITGDDAVKAIEFDHSSGIHEKLDTSCIFIMTSLPTSTFLEKAGCEFSETKSIKVDKEQRTNIGGVFACGDICGNGFQVSIAVGEGAIAGMNAAKYIRGLKKSS
ncbi:MAG: NAD(P)/FAD-dependent oxidoreductase [Candidatus Hodarchaeota archaeon]